LLHCIISCNSGPCNSFNCLGHFTHVYDDEDDDDDDDDDFLLPLCGEIDYQQSQLGTPLSAYCQQIVYAATNQQKDFPEDANVIKFTL